MFVLALVFWVVGILEQGQAAMVPLIGLTAITVVAIFALAKGQPLSLALETPPAAVIFVLLAKAAIRHRPLQVLYMGGLFVAVWVRYGWLVATRRSGHSRLTRMSRMAVLGLVTIALVVAMTRERWAVLASITEARLRCNLSRYFSPNLVEKLARAGDDARSFRSQKAAILFADLRSFTALAEPRARSRNS